MSNIEIPCIDSMEIDLNIEKSEMDKKQNTKKKWCLSLGILFRPARDTHDDVGLFQQNGNISKR